MNLLVPLLTIGYFLLRGKTPMQEAAEEMGVTAAVTGPNGVALGSYVMPKRAPQRRVGLGAVAPISTSGRTLVLKRPIRPTMEPALINTIEPKQKKIRRRAPGLRLKRPISADFEGTEGTPTSDAQLLKSVASPYHLARFDRRGDVLANTMPPKIGVKNPSRRTDDPFNRDIVMGDDMLVDDYTEPGDASYGRETSADWEADVQESAYDPDTGAIITR